MISCFSCKREVEKPSEPEETAITFLAFTCDRIPDFLDPTGLAAACLCPMAMQRRARQFESSGIEQGAPVARPRSAPERPAGASALVEAHKAGAAG